MALRSGNDFYPDMVPVFRTAATAGSFGQVLSVTVIRWVRSWRSDVRVAVRTFPSSANFVWQPSFGRVRLPEK